MVRRVRGEHLRGRALRMEETLVKDAGEVFQRISEHSGRQTHFRPSGRLRAMGEVDGITDRRR